MGRPSDQIRAAIHKKGGGHPRKSGGPSGRHKFWAGRPPWPQRRHEGGHPQIEGGPNVAAAGPMGRPWWPGGRPCGSRAAGDAIQTFELSADLHCCRPTAAAVLLSSACPTAHRRHAPIR
eukprot:scaffold133375_cov91-Phaeocystis_antarctica.AAC.2